MKKWSFLLLLSLGLITACNDDEASSETLTMALSELPNLGTDYVYEGWLANGSGVVSGGRFTIDDAGMPSQSSFSFPGSEVSGATGYILTIEPANETGTDLDTPSSTHILAGDFTGNTANITTSDARALGTDFSTAVGSYILATPTTAVTTDENSGFWFLDPAGGPGASLTLPTLPAGWKYEGWAVVDGMPYSSGTFTSVTGADDTAQYSGTDMAPPFPGEDFVMGNAAFPFNIAGGKIVVSVEPDTDNSPMPFSLKPLVGDVPAMAADHTSYNMGLNVGNLPSGVISR